MREGSAAACENRHAFRKRIGGMAEWFKAAVLKTAVVAIPP